MEKMLSRRTFSAGAAPSYAVQRHQGLSRPLVRKWPHVQAAAGSAPTKPFAGFPLWEAMFVYLRDKKFNSVSPQTAQEMAESGAWALVDVRPPEVYAKAHIKGALSVPLFQSVNWSKADAKTVMRSVAFLFNGVNPVEVNPAFVEQMAAIAATGKGIITYCEAGGSMKPSISFPQGKASRSLQAAFRLVREEIAPKVAHLEGGAYGWYEADLPFDGEYDTSNVGRTPNAVRE